MTKEFKVGQKVKLTDQRNYGAVTTGAEYTVMEVHGKKMLLNAHKDFLYPFCDFELASTPNGVDAYGESISFTLADLKPFQRVVLRNAHHGIITSSENGTLAVTFADSSWTQAELEDNDWGIVEVYAPPANHWQGLNVKAHGALVFSTRNFVAERVAKLAEADAAIADAEAKLAAARAAKAAI